MSDLDTIDPQTGEIHRPTVLMTEAEAQKITAEIKAWAGTLWLKLKQAHDGQAWRAMGYSSWRAYIDGEFDMGKSQAYRLLTHANAVYEIAEAAGLDPAELSPAGDTLTERTTRGIDLDAVLAAITEAVEGIEPGATATRQELARRIVDAARLAANEITKPSDPGDPTLPGSDAPEAPAASGATSPEPATDGTHGKAGDDDAAATEGSEGDGPATGPLAESSGADGASTVVPDGAGGTGPTEGPAPSTTTIEAAERAAVSTDMVAARRLLERDPAAVVALMSAEDAETWCAHVDDMADFAHRWELAMKDRNKLRSVQ